MVNGYKVLFFAAAIMVSQINGQAVNCVANSDCAGNTLATSKTCCTKTVTAGGVTNTAGLCSDKSLVGTAVDYCLTDSETVCSKCSSSQICCQYSLKDVPNAPATATGRTASCSDKTAYETALKATPLPSYMKCGSVYVAYSFLLAMFATLMLAF